jgi:hypothetical protein
MMRSKQLVCLVALIGVWGAGAPALSACGDKFLALGRSLSRYQGFASVHPGVIALYTRDAAGATDGMAVLRKILMRAGHRVNIVDVTTLGPLVNASGVDIVLASANDSDALGTRIGTTSRQPTVLYVALPRERGAVARRGVSPVTPVLKPDDTPEKFLRVIEEAMKGRTKAGVKVKL